MPLLEKIRDKLEGRIADFVLALCVGAAWVVAWLADAFFPNGVLLSAQIFFGLCLTALLLLVWVVYLQIRLARLARPQRKFLQEQGFWEDLRDHQYYCAKCSVTPLAKHEAGWYCAKCHWLYQSQEYLEKQKRKREEEDRRVREFNESRRF